jgi:hypothetical protein
MSRPPRLRPSRPSTAFLQAVTVVVGVMVLTALVFEPHLEGRNTNATLVDIYFRDPFLLFVYVGSIPFFVTLCHTFRLLGHVGSGDRRLSWHSLRAAQLIRSWVRVTLGFVAVGVAILMITGDERPVALFLGLVPTMPLLTIAWSAASFERLLQRRIDLQTDDDLTV